MRRSAARITFASGDSAAAGRPQRHQPGGQVLEHRSPQDSLRLIYAEEEFYAEESLLGMKRQRQRPELGRSVELMLLKASPGKVGTAWRDDQNFQREIVALDQVVEVPLGVVLRCGGGEEHQPRCSRERAL
jgi:hypothetical protein